MKATGVHYQERAAAVVVDPGNDPPLSIGSQVPDRRQVSLHWLTGTILTGLFGAALMGGAIYAAFEGHASVASPPTTVAITATVQDGDAGRGSDEGKGDLLVRRAAEIAERRTIRVSTTTRVGDKDVIKAKPFTQIMANLSLNRGAFAWEVPAYNPIKILTEAGPEPAAPEALPVDDGEVSLVARDLAPIVIGADAGLVLPIENVRALVAEQADFESLAESITVPPALLGSFGGGDEAAPALAYAGEPLDARTALDIRVVPENVTEVPKAATDGSLPDGEHTIQVQDGETLASILTALGATEAEVEDAKRALGEAAELTEGQRLRVLVMPAPDDPERGQPVRVSVYRAASHLATVALSDAGPFVPVTDPDSAAGEDDVDDEGGGIRLYESIFETALEQDVPKPMIERMMRIYAYDVDLSRRARPGDTFEVFYEGGEDGEPHGDLLYTSLTVGNELKRFYRFVTPDDDQVDFYDENGRSARKFLLRTPINGAESRSGFGMRRHPILRYMKMHTGHDWAAPYGSPIFAAGNGTVIAAGWKAGYGRRVEIQHANGYVTSYSHLSGFARGIRRGVRVTMGQTIGFLGSSGLSTGPHLHYEVLINGNFVDPMRIRLPQGRELRGELLAAFKAERDRIDELMAQAPVTQAASVEAPTQRASN